MALQPLCEFVDVTDRSITMAVRLLGQSLSSGSTYTLILRSRRGKLMAQANAEVVPRVDSVGVWTRSALIFTFTTGDIPYGSFRLGLVPHDENEGARQRETVVAPASGLLANSRPVVAAERRIQMFPAAGRPAVWVRCTATSRFATAAWTVQNIVNDVAFAAHTRRFSWVRLARIATKRMVPRGPIWLIGERPETARDNGRALFAYLRRVRPDAAVYYVITADSPMRTAVEPLGNVVTHSSWRHRILMLHVAVLANAYSIKHMVPASWHPGAYMAQASWRVGALRVYLKHGVHLSPYALKRATGGYDLVATVGQRETEALRETSGYGDEVVETGLARYDALLSSGMRSNTILFMPTWRRYLVPKLFSSSDESLVAYEGSAYQRFVEDLLTSPALAHILSDHDLTLQVLPHYNLASVLHLPSALTRRVQLLDAATADIPMLLRTCDLLVTDYSSVQFDVAYVGTPMVYCQFDAQDYSTGHSAFSWFEAKRDGFGPVTADAESTVKAIEAYADNGFAREPVYDDRASAVFAHHDDRNAERLVAAIDDRLLQAAGQGKKTNAGGRRNPRKIVGR